MISFSAHGTYIHKNAYQAAVYAEVLKAKDIEPVRSELEAIKPFKAAFDKNYAKRIDGDNVKKNLTRWQMVEELRKDIRNFKQETEVSRVVVLWAASTEIYVPYEEDYHSTLEKLETAMKPTIANTLHHQCVMHMQH